MEESKLNKYSGALNSNAHPAYLPEGDLVSAVNAVSGEDQTDESLLKRERGTTLSIQLPEGYKLWGHVYINNNEAIAAWGNGSVEQIILVKQNEEVEVLVEANFNFSAWVDMTYRVRKGCENTIYFTDCKNPVRTINLDDLERYKKNGVYDTDLFDLFRPYKVACIVSGEVVNTGGNVRYGSYNISFQYLDHDLNPTISMYASNILTVNDRDFGIFNFDVNPQIGKANSNRSLKWIFDGLDPDFPYYRIIVAEASTGTGFANKFYVSNHQSTKNNIFIYDGNPTNFKESTRDEMITQRILWDRASYIEQVEQKLILGGLKGPDYDYCGWQKFASKICAEYVVEEIDPKEYLKKGMNTGVWDNTLMGDEVYAAGIVYVDKRGRTHPAFHILGTGVNQSCDCEEDVTPGDGCHDLAVVLWRKSNAAGPTVLKALIKVVYLVNGAEFTYEEIYEDFVSGDEPGGPIGGETEIKYICFGDKVTLKSLTWEPLNDENFSIDLNFTVRQPWFSGGSNPNNQKLYGQDDTVYSSWNKDMSFLITEERYKLVIDEYNKKNNKNVIYGNNSASNLKELKNIDGLPRRWQIYNTATPDGRLAYYQCAQAVYENPLKDCGITDYWGVDSCGKLIEGTPVRHIKMPDRTIVPLFKNGKLRRLGLKFTNIEYPHPDIVGHYIVLAKRDDFNRTIVDKGILNPTHRSPFYPGRHVEGFSYWTKQNSPDNSNYTSPKLHLSNESTNGYYIKGENDYLFYNHYLFGTKYDGRGRDITDTDINIVSRNFIHKDSIDPKFGNALINDQFALDPLSVYEKSDRIVVNNSQTTKIGFIQTDRTIDKNHPNNEGQCAPYPDNGAVQLPYALPYVAIKVKNDVHCVLESIKYFRAHNCVKTGDTTVFGDVFMTRMDFTHLLLRERYKLGDALFGSLFSGTRDPIYEYLFGQGEFTQLINDGCMDSVLTSTNFIEFAGELLSVWVESDYNWQLRSNGDTLSNGVYRWNDIIDRRDQSLIVHFLNQVAQKKEEDGDLYYELNISAALEFYFYNLDYSRKNMESVYFSLPSTYNCCSNCLEEFPNRVAYSENSFQEELTDNYRIFKANNYRDIDSERGRMTDLWRDGNLLYVHLTEALYQVPYGYQEVVRDSIVTYIGDGGFFSQAPRPVVDADTGTAGSLNRQSTIKIPSGVFFVDEMSSVPYIYSNGLKPIAGDYSAWFTKNLRPWFKNEFKKLFGNDVTVPEDIAYNIATYDETNNRIILTKRDYSFRKGTWEYSDGSFIFNGEVVKVGDKKAFINRSFTISYFISKGYWRSLHSYIPEYYLYTKDWFASFYKSGLWIHNSDKYCHFYGKQAPFIVDLPVSPGEDTKVFNDLVISLKTERKMLGGKVVTNDFFDQVVIYNSWQSSGLLEINKKSSFLTIANGKANAIKREQDWALNEFRDMVISNDEPLFIEDRDQINEEFYIDKIPNPAATSKLKTWSEQEDFRDKYLMVRLYLTGLPEVQFIFRSIINSENISE